jgi:hypothetical protein
MAKLHEEVIVLKISKLLKDNDNAPQLADNEVLTALEQVATELLGGGVMIEFERA